MKYLILLQGLLTIFIAGGLFFKESSLKNRSIALYFLLFALEILYFVYGTSLIPTIYPELIGRFYFSIGMLYGPILLFHFKSAVNVKPSINRYDLLHFIPVVVLNVYMMDILLMEDVARFNYFNNIDNFFNRILYINYVRALHQIIYAFILYSIYKRYKYSLNVNEKFYLGGLSVIYLLTTVLITLLVLFARSWQDFSWYYNVSNVLILLILYVIYKDPKFFKKFKEKYKSSGLEERDMDLIKQKLNTYFKEEEVYLDNDLTIDKLSKELGIKSHQISQTLSAKIQENFNDYVNRHRIEHSKKLLRDNALDHYKIEAIADMSGFNNKVTFYKAFSKFTDSTPSKYRKNE